MNAVLILLTIALALAAGGYLLWVRRPRGDLTPPLPQAAIDMELVGEEVAKPVAEAIPPSMHPMLDFEGPPGRIAISKPAVTIGRHSEDDVRIPDIRMSRNHARLILRPNDRFELDNLTAVRSEPNPMLVNGVEKEHAVLEDGDVVTLGGTSFTFHKHGRAEVA